MMRYRSAKTCPGANREAGAGAGDGVPRVKVGESSSEELMGGARFYAARTGGEGPGAARRITSMTTAELPDWERLLAAERHLQSLLPGAVLVGGTAAALHAGHRSLDGDHVLEDLRPRFDDVLATLEQAAGWQTSRFERPVLILGRLDGVMTGIRQMRRTVPLETETVDGLRVPTLAEMARIKAWLLATRRTVRDDLDLVVLLERLGEPAARDAFASFDTVYAQSTGASVLSEVVERLAAAAPTDLAEVDLATYKALVPPWNDWGHLAAGGRHWAAAIAAWQLGAAPA